AAYARDRARPHRRRGRRALRLAAHLRVGNGGVRRAGHDHRGGPRGDRATRPRGAARALETSARRERGCADPVSHHRARDGRATRSEEHTSELQSLRHLVCRLLLEKKKKKKKKKTR